MTSPPFIRSPLLDAAHNIRYGFFTRQGGASKGAFDSLNCSRNSGDEMAHIERNRRIVTECLGAENLFTLKQIHSNRVVVIDEQSDPDARIEADGMVSRRKNICLGSMGADCAPVLFVDSQAEVIGSAHAGWQGALSGVTDAVIREMCRLGASKDRIVCAIGPAIQWQSYEVGEDFRENLIRKSDIPSGDFFRADKNSGNIHFNLPGYIRARVINAGVSRVDQLVEDTYSDRERFFSYRRNCHENEAQYGRQIGAVCLV